MLCDGRFVERERECCVMGGMWRVLCLEVCGECCVIEGMWRKCCVMGGMWRECCVLGVCGESVV